MIGRLNHVGVAVPSIEAAKATYRDLYGVPESAISVVVAVLESMVLSAMRSV